MIYIGLFLLLFLLSYHYDFRHYKKGKVFWINFILIAFIFVAGLRWRLGTDTPSYIYHFYYDTPLLSKLTVEDLTIGVKPLWVLLNSFVKTLGGKYYVVQLIEAAFVNLLTFKYIKKHSRYIFTCLIFYFIAMYFSLNMEVMKAAMSIVVSFYANDYAFEKKWRKAALLYSISVLFHPQAIIIVIMFLFLYWLRLNKIGVLFLIVMFFAGIIVQDIFGDLFIMFEMDDALERKGELLASGDSIEQVHSQIYLLTCMYVYIVYAIIALWYLKRHCVNSPLLKFEPFLLFYAGFYIIAINSHIFYRFGMYYSIYLVLYLSEMFVDIARYGHRLSFEIKYFKAFCVILPFLLLVGERLESKSYRYYPYYSVIDRKVDKYREMRGMDARLNWNTAKINEY